MDSIFGISMNAILAMTLSIMLACLASTALIALRNRVIFRMALRNIPRRKAQTVLIMVGLMLSTLIVAAALTTGDTLDHSVTASTYEGLGEVDVTISYVGSAGGEGSVSANTATIPASLAADLELRLADDPDIDAVMPVLTIAAPVTHDSSGLSEPRAIVTGLDAARLDAFGGLQTPSGEAIDFGNLPPGAAVVSEDLANRLDARPGDTIVFVFGNEPRQITVGAIARGSILTGYETVVGQAGPARIGASSLLGLAVPLAWLQEVTGLEGQARFIAVSNSGGVESGVARTDAVVARLTEALASVEGGRSLGVNPLKQEALEAAELFGNIFTTLFLLFGMFSIASGVLLIFLVFTMLATERRPEMGMARAVGMTRSQLVRSFVVEGVAYDLGAAMIGAATGVLVSFAITLWLGSLLGDAFVSIAPLATWRSLVAAYSLGVSVTFLTIVFASTRASRMNVAAAIRDLADETHPDRGEPPHWRWWSRLSRGGAVRTVVSFPLETIWNVALLPFKAALWLLRLLTHALGWGLVIGSVGVAFMVLGTAAQSYFPFALGISLLTLGGALFGRRYLPSRLVFTTAAVLMLLFWLLPPSVTARVLPELGDGGPEMFFLSGIFMVLYTTLIIMWNADLLVRFVALLGGAFSRWIPAVKTAVAYPLASRGRTGMTIAMFAMVIFSLVTVRTINANFVGLLLTDEAAAGWDVVVTTNPANPIDDLPSALAGSDVDEADLGAVGRLSGVAFLNSLVRASGDAEWARLSIGGMDEQFIRQSVIPLAARAPEYADDAAVWDALLVGEPVAIVDVSVFDSDGFAAGGDRFMAPSDIRMDGDRLTPFDIELQGSASGATQPIRVIGVIESRVSTLSGLYLSHQVFDGLYANADLNRFYVRLDGAATADANTLAKQIESALRSNGVQAESIADQIAEQQAFSRGFFAMLQGFMGLGLFVGIAALGVISFRSVVERRQQIGMLRAIGCQRGMVAASFLIESVMIATVGVVSGSILATILSYNLIIGGGIDDSVQFTTFVIPWSTILFFNAAAVIAAAAMTWAPARRAASVPIADALRFE
ncbi:MAG TPA: FtsX-like permease family protein [Thermomicrobiales bacterium]|nr:FtsX-like permease family protein [Thermomicrobiales bacterium]